MGRLLSRIALGYAQRRLWRTSPLLFGAYWLWRYFKGRNTQRPAF